MKKVLPVLVLILALTGCSGNKSGDIKKREFNKGERELLGELGYSDGRDLVSFDLDLSKLEVLDIIKSIDYYKDGEFVETVFEMSTTIDNEPLDIKSKRITWSRKELSLEDEKVHRELWTINSNSGWGSTIIEMLGDRGASGMHLNEDFQGSLEKNKKYPLAIYYRTNANSFMVSDIDFDNMDATLENLKKFEEVYILYAEIK